MSQWTLRHVPSSRAPTSSALALPKAHESVCSWAWGFSSSVGLLARLPKAACSHARHQVRSSVLGGHLDFFSPLPSLGDPFMHSQPTNGLLAARDCAGAMSPLRVHEKRLLMRELAHGRARPRNIVTRTSAQRLIATEMDIRSRRSTRVQGLEKLRATCRSGLPGQRDG